MIAMVVVDDAGQPSSYCRGEPQRVRDVRLRRKGDRPPQGGQVRAAGDEAVVVDQFLRGAEPVQLVVCSIRAHRRARAGRPLADGSCRARTGICR